MSVIIYFGVPGSGKSTLAAKIAYQNSRKGIKTYSNVPIMGTLLINSADIGKVDISNGDLILDEAAIDFNNRSYKSMPKAAIEWFKLHRHYGIGTIHVFSQSYEDMDITLRRLQTQMSRISRTLIPGIFMSRRIAVVIAIDKDNKQITEHHRWFGLPRFYCGFRYWPMFDSYSAPALPDADFESVGIPANSSFKSLRKAIRSTRLANLKRKISFLLIKFYSKKLMKGGLGGKTFPPFIPPSPRQ